MRSLLILAVPATLANGAEVCAEAGTCAQDEATLLQLHGLRAKQTPDNQVKGCPNGRLDDYVGGNVRCCSQDGTSCYSGLSRRYTFEDGNTVEGRTCNAGDCNGVSDQFCHDDVSLDQAAQICRANGDRLCTQAEVESAICCGTGCMHNFHHIWFSDPSPSECSLSAYWEYDSCGCGGNDQNQAWCGGIGSGDCPDTVETSVCPSGTAYLAEWHPKPYAGNGHAGRGTEGHLVRDGCEYIWHAQYACDECALSAYWEYGNGGCGGNDQNQNWCGGIRTGDCPATVETDLCPSGIAYRATWHPKPYAGTGHQQGHAGHLYRGGEEYIWHAQYACQHPFNLENGGFEEGFGSQETANPHIMSSSGYEYTTVIPGWTASGGTVMVANGNAPWGGIGASSGDYLLALQSASAEIKQTVSNLRVGQSYTLTVNAAQRTNSPGGQNAALKVSVNGVELMNEVVTSTTMEAQVMTFTADSGTAEIKIENDVASGDQTVFVDGITLVAA